MAANSVAGPSVAPDAVDYSNRDQVVRRYHGFVRWYARRAWKATKRRHDMRDLMSYGMMGLLAALPNYNPSRGSFTTCAGFYIRSHLREGVANLSGTTAGKFKSNRDAGMPLRIVLLKSAEIEDEDDGGKGVPVFAPDLDAEIDRTSLVHRVLAAIRGLPENQRRVLVARELEERTFDEIGKQTGSSRQAAFQTYNFAMRRLRTQFSGVEI